MKPILEQLEERLNAIGSVACALLPSSDPIPYQRLIVNVGEDSQQRERIVEITAQEQKSLFPQGIKPPLVLGQYVRLQFQFVFPFPCQLKALPDVCSFVLFLNRLIELPGFELSEVERKLFYRYVLLANSADIDATLCVSLLGVIMMLLDLLTEPLEKIAGGVVSFNEMLTDMIDTLEKQH
jgi:hypothetical protein